MFLTYVQLPLKGDGRCYVFHLWSAVVNTSLKLMFTYYTQVIYVENRLKKQVLLNR